MNLRIVVPAALALAGCGSKGGGKAVGQDAAPVGSTVTSAPEAPRVPPPVPAGTRSLRLTRTVAARLGPDEKSKRIGTIAGDTRVGWREAAAGPGCKKPWFALDGQGWVCGDFIEASPKAPSGVELPRLERGEIVPGEYGKVIEAGTNVYTLPPPAPKKPGKGKGKKAPEPESDGPVTMPDGVGPAEVSENARAAAAAGLVKGRPLLGSVNVRKYGELVAGGKLFWKISSRGEPEYLPASAIRQHKPSTFRGTRLGDDTGITLPVAFVWPRGGMTKAWTRGAAKGGGVRRQLDQRTVVPILEESVQGTAAVAYRIGEAEWIDASNLRVVKPVPPPPGIGPTTRWIDVDLDLQVLVAYEGTMPVYATMVSTGLKDTPTATGTYRVWKKASEADMKGLSGEDPYSVATVPWTQWFFPEEGLALHTSYWHDRFGWPKSHGCVNLAPIDARWLYFFTDPQVPPGWSMAAGVVEAPGSIVRVRNAAEPNPPVKGYASKIETE